MKLMNQIFKDFFDTFVIVFIDNIVVYSKTNVEHEAPKESFNSDESASVIHQVLKV